MSKEKEKDAKIADAVLEAAQKVFERKGAKQATIEEIAAEAKLDAKKVKAVFPNVEAVIQEVLDRDVEETSELFTRTINDRGKADVKLTRLVRELLLATSTVTSCRAWSVKGWKQVTKTSRLSKPSSRNATWTATAKIPPSWDALSHRGKARDFLRTSIRWKPLICFAA